MCCLSNKSCNLIKASNSNIHFINFIDAYQFWRIYCLLLNDVSSHTLQHPHPSSLIFFEKKKSEKMKGAKWGIWNSRHLENLNKLYDLSTLQLVRSLIQARVKLGSLIYCLFCVALSNFTQSFEANFGK